MSYNKKSNNIKKVVAGICALAMLCTVVFGSTNITSVFALTFGSPQTQMLKDGDFESGGFASGWEIKDNAGAIPAIISGNFVTGVKLLYLNGISDTVFQKFNVVKDKTYVLEFSYANSNGGNAERFIDVEIKGSQKTYLQKTFTSAESPYAKAYFTFTAAKSESVTLSFIHATSEGIYIDDVSVKTASEVLVKNMSGGTLVADKDFAVKGETVNVTVLPYNGMELKVGTLVYETEDGEIALTPTDESDVYSFEMPSTAVKLKAEFSKIIMDTVLGSENIVDGGFSQGIGSSKPWATSGLASALAATATSDYANVDKVGDKCIKINKNKGGVLQKNITLKGGYSYELSYLFAPMVSPGGTSSTINVKIVDSNSNSIYSETVSSSGYKFEKISRNFVVDEDATVTLSIDRLQTQGSTSIYIDDVSLVAVEKITELIKNGSFDEDNNATGWTVYTNWSTALGVPHSGYKGAKDVLNNAIKISSYGGGFFQEITLEKNQSYVLSFFVAAGATGGVKNYVDVSIKTPEGMVVLEKIYSSYDYPYRYVTYNFISYTDGEATIRFDRQNYDGGDLYIDDVSIKPVVFEKASFEKKSLVKNGDFENVFDGVDGDGNPAVAPKDWTLRWKAKTNTLHPNSGKYCANIAQYSGGISQDVELVSGAKYKLGFYWNPNTSDGSSRVMDITLGENLNEKVVCAGNEYTYYSFEFTAAKSGSFSLIFNRQNYVGDSFLDDVTLETIAYVGDNYVKDSGFEEEITTGSKPEDFLNSGDIGWRIFGTATITDEEAPQGNNSLKLTNIDSKGIYGVFDVDANAPIRLKYKFKGSSDSKATVKITTDVKGKNVIYRETLSGADLWKDYTADFETGNNTDKLYVNITSSEGTNLFDCFELYKLARIELIVKKGGTAKIDKMVALPDEKVMLNVISLEDGVSIPEGSPNYVCGMTVGSMKEIVADSLYAMITPDDDFSITLYFDMPINRELLLDGGFESGKFVQKTSSSSGWASESNTADIIEGAFRGKYAVSVNAGAGKSVYQTDIHLQEGSTYRLSYYHSGCSYNAGIYIMENDAVEFTEPLLCGDDDEWNRYSKDFVASKNVTVSIVLKNIPGLENAVFDNISLMKVNPNSDDSEAWNGNYDKENDTAPTGRELLKDRSFEEHGAKGSSVEYWKIFSEAIVDKISYSAAVWAVSDGEYAACIAAGASEGIYQEVKLKPYSAYELTFDYIVDREGCSVSVGPNLSKNSAYGLCEDLKPADEPTKRKIVFVTGETGDAVVLMTNKSARAAYFDNFSLKEIDNTVKNDLDFRFSAYIKATEIGENNIDIVWSAAKSKLYNSKDLSYSIYCSDKPITEKNYKQLTPLLEQSGEKVRRLSVTDLENGTDYYFAVVVTDLLGNIAYLMPEPIKTLKTPGYTLVNPSFEFGTLEGWNDWQNNKIRILSGGSDGKYMARFLDWAFRLDQQILGYEDSEYVFSFDAMQSSPIPLNYGFQLFDGKNNSTILKGMIDSSTGWKKYTGTFKTLSDTKRITAYFGNGDDYNYAHLDNIYLKKIDNKDLYFISRPQLCIAGENYIIMEWYDVVSKDEKSNIVYQVYYSNSPITPENIENMEPIQKTKGDASLNVVISGLDVDTKCYFAVRASDSLGNVATEYTIDPITPNVSELNKKDDSDNDEQKQEESSSGSESFGSGEWDDEDGTNEDKDESQKTPIVDVTDDITIEDEYVDNQFLEFDDEKNTRIETEEVTVMRTASRTVNKNIPYRSQIKHTLGLIFVIAGVAVLLGMLVLLIVLLKKSKKKWLSIVIMAVALVAVVVGVWLLLTAETFVKKKVVETKEVPVTSVIENVVEDENTEENQINTDNSFVDTDIFADDNESEDNNLKEETNSDKETDSEDFNSNENTNFEDKNESISDAEVIESKTYYVSSSEGNDKNDGLSPEKPIKTLEKMAELPLNEKDTVRFKCGDLWRGVCIDAVPGVTYSSYGKGNNPTFYGSKKNYADSSEWQSSGYLNIWVSKDSLGKIGSMSFNNDKEMAVYVHTEETNPGVLKTNGEFCYDWDSGKVYLYCDNGNPGNVYESIEVFTENRIMYVYSGNTVENIKMKYGNYGVQCWTGENVTIRNLDISYCGGTCATTGIRAGNGIEFWYNLENIVIENNVISNMYDTGITCQWAGNVSTDIVMKDIYVRNNNITQCHWSTEFWIYAQGVGQGVIKNLNITDNYFGYAGEGWSTKQRALSNMNQYPYHIHGMSYDNYAYLDINIVGNTFDCSKGALFSFQYQGYVPNLEGNTYIQYKDNSFGTIYGKMFTFDENLETLLGVLEKNPVWKFAE